MKAATYYRYGGPEVVELREITIPSPGDNQLLVRVKAASLNPYDWHFMRGKPRFMRFMTGLFRPKVNGLGADLAGVVEAVGDGVTDFAVGDEIFGGTSGAFAECALVADKSVIPKPPQVSFEQAAATPMAAQTALQGLRDKGQLQSGQRVLINGASGGVGTFAVQIARTFGAHVTAVCSARNVDLVRSLGADRAIDYTSEDFTSDGPLYHLMLDTVGNRTATECRRVLVPGGKYVMVGADSDPRGFLYRAITMMLPFRSGNMETTMMLARHDRKDLLALSELLVSGDVKAVVDQEYLLDDLREAIRHLETGHVRGKIVLCF